MVTYGGDEVSAVVVAATSDDISFGYAGEDTPKRVVTPYYSTSQSDGKSYTYVGDDGACVWRPASDVKSVISDGMVDNMDVFERIVETTFSTMRLKSEEHAMLLTEPAWNSTTHRENIAELFFEKFDAPGFYIANESVLSSFSAGKSSALIVSLQGDSMSAVPVYEGFVLRKGVIRQPLGGQSVTKSLLNLCPEVANNLLPHQIIAAKTAVEARNPADIVINASRQEGTSQSWLTYHQNVIANDWRDSVVQVLEAGWNDSQAAARPSKSYEFPNGYNSAFGAARYHAAEVLFSPSKYYIQDPQPSLFTSSSSSSQAQPTIPSLPAAECIGIAEMILKSIFTTDADIRTALLGNIVLVGSLSSMPGLTDRLTWELNQLAPNNKIKIHSPANYVERKLAPWLGGSIIASLGTFHQLWVSAEEFKEIGKSVLSKRCK